MGTLITVHNTQGTTITDANHSRKERVQFDKVRFLLFHSCHILQFLVIDHDQNRQALLWP